MINCLLVGLGGFFGSVCRYLIGLIPISESAVFPIKTLLINVLGAFVIGVLMFSFQGARSMDPKLLLMLRVGVCGGFTTFSTFAFETFELLEGNSFAAAILYAALSLALGIGAVYAARAIFS